MKTIKIISTAVLFALCTAAFADNAGLVTYRDMTVNPVSEKNSATGGTFTMPLDNFTDVNGWKSVDTSGAFTAAGTLSSKYAIDAAMVTRFKTYYIGGYVYDYLAASSTSTDTTNTVSTSGTASTDSEVITPQTAAADMKFAVIAGWKDWGFKFSMKFGGYQTDDGTAFGGYADTSENKDTIAGTDAVTNSSFLSVTPVFEAGTALAWKGLKLTPHALFAMGFNPKETVIKTTDSSGNTETVTREYYYSSDYYTSNTTLIMGIGSGVDLGGSKTFRQSAGADAVMTLYLFPSNISTTTNTLNTSTTNVSMTQGEFNFSLDPSYKFEADVTDSISINGKAMLPFQFYTRSHGHIVTATSGGTIYDTISDYGKTVFTAKPAVAAGVCHTLTPNKFFFNYGVKLSLSSFKAESIKTVYDRTASSADASTDYSSTVKTDTTTWGTVDTAFSLGFTYQPFANLVIDTAATLSTVQPSLNTFWSNCSFAVQGTLRF